MKGLINIKKILVIVLILLSAAGCSKSENISGNIPENLKKAEIINLDADVNSLKGRINISADDKSCAVKTNSFNKDFKQIEYTVSSLDKEELFRVSAINPDGISEKSFDMYAVYEDDNISGYIQSNVFRGNESYIIYDQNGEKYAFCYIGEKSEYKIISFDDELLYTLNLSNPTQNKFDIAIKRMRPDSEYDISAVALAFIINTDCNNKYFEMQDKLKKT